MNKGNCYSKGRECCGLVTVGVEMLGGQYCDLVRTYVCVGGGGYLRRGLYALGLTVHCGQWPEVLAVANQ